MTDVAVGLIAFGAGVLVGLIVRRRRVSVHVEVGAPDDHAS